jgi:hypothetical protein
MFTNGRLAAPSGHQSKRAFRRAVAYALDWQVRTRPRAQKGPGPQVLLAGSNHLMIDYLLDVWQCIRDIDGVSGTITCVKRLSPGQEQAARESGLSVLPLWRAQLRGWTLIVLSDHMPWRFAKSIPKVRVRHGGPGDRSNSRAQGGNYFYDRKRVLWPDGTPVYQRMLEGNETQAELGRRLVPEYADRITVIGDLRADDLVAGAAQRPALRRRLGVDAFFTLAVMSTWGPHALIPRHGHWLLPALRTAIDTEDYAVILTMHPNLWATKDPDFAALVKSHAGERFHVVEAGAELGDYLPAADAIITDHTSLAVTCSVLGRPMIPISVSDEVLGENTFARRLVLEYPTVGSAAQLADALRQVRTGEVSYHMAPGIDYVGYSRQRLRDAIAAELEACG